MPSRKQRRRRDKTFRHEYETVLLDAEGNEIEVDPDELRAQREEKRAAKAKPAAKGKQTRGGRPLREAPPPTWPRAIKRGATMGAVMLIVFIFLIKDAPIGLRIGWGLLYGAAFIPLTYLIDRTAYRTFKKRQAKNS